MAPIRIQRRRIKGWKMPANTVSVCRPGQWGNPFRVGGYFAIGRGRGIPGFAWLEALDEKYADARFTRIADEAQAVEFFRIYRERYPDDLSELRGKNLACFCALDQPCHADVLLELANAPPSPVGEKP